MYLDNIARLWLTAILILVPFQKNIVKNLVLWNSELSKFIGYVDEITIIIFLLLSVTKFIQTKEFKNPLYFILLFPFLAFSLSGLISGVINNNSLMITILGVFDYLKNFIVIFIYAVFFKEFKDVKRTFSILLTIAFFLSVVAIIQEFWAIGNRYVMEKGISDISYFLSENKGWRFGLYRTPSLMHHPNMFALYILLIISIYVCTARKVNFLILVPFCSGVLLSISKIAYTGLIIIIGLMISRGKKWPSLFLIIFSVILSFYSSFLLDTTTLQRIEGRYSDLSTESPWPHYRTYSRDKAIEIWKDHPIFGIGPGMFGGVVSIKSNSYVYEEYNFDVRAKIFVNEFRSIDQFWPQLLGETGIVGTLNFCALLISLNLIFFMLRKQVASEEMRGLFFGVMIFTIVIIIYTSGSGLNLTSILFTYSALVGMGLGSSKNKYYLLN
jgi:O-antigen ligase